MKRIPIIAIILVIVLIFAGVAFVYWNGGGTEKPEDDVPILARFDSKLVYTTDTSTSTERFRAHCESSGGEFNECGTSCAPDAAVCAQVCAFTCENIGGDDGSSIDTSEWSTFGDEGYDFSLRYNAGSWSTAKDSSSFDFSPKYNVYKRPEGISLTFPITHHSNVTNVSVFPLGIPTEGMFGEAVPFEEDVGFAVSNNSRMYVLEDGTPFAAFIRPTTVPSSWSGAGFVWMRVRIENLETYCLRGGVRLDEEDCDPLVSDDTIVRTGTVDTSLWEEELAIVRTLSFGSSNGGSATGTDMVRIEAPRPGEVISSPLTVEGEARGPWYFEASFPVILTDWDGRIIAEVPAQAEGEWMTENFVPYTAGLSFTSPYSTGDPDFMQNGALILQKSNPSGLPEHADAFEIPVRFAPQ